MKILLNSAIAAALAIAILPSTASAFSGKVEVYGKMGNCNVRARVYNSQSADVTIATAGDPTSGSALWSNGKIIRFTGITKQSIESCGFTNVSNLQQTGASGSFNSDNHIGFSFKGTYGSIPVAFKAALRGAKNTRASFTYSYFKATSQGFGNLGQR